jgi:hypothetical protein
MSKIVSTLLCSVALLLVTEVGDAADIDANSFHCITKMTPVRQFYVDNLEAISTPPWPPPIRRVAPSIHQDPSCN